MGSNKGLADDPSRSVERARQILIEFFEEERREPCLPRRSPEELVAAIDLLIPDRGKTDEELFALARQVVLNSPRTASRAFFNLLFSGRVAAALAGDILAAALNNTIHTFKGAGLQVLIEQVVVDELCRQAGFPSGEGILTPGGSLSNLVAMAVARNEALADVRDDGHWTNRLTAYTSDQGHYSIVKNAGILGIGRNLVRHVTSDQMGRIRPDQLEELIRQDLKTGLQPFFVNATAGTTVLGAYDSIPPLHDLCRHYGIWLHVDAAFGGSALLSSRHRELLTGCEQADSLTWDLHKMMGVPVSASAILMRKKGLLAENFAEPAGYLFQSEDDAFNPGLRSIQCGRRNDALKCWMALQSLGRDGYERRVDKQFELARQAADAVTRRPELELILEPQSINVCFRMRGRPARHICEELDRRGIAKIGWGSFRGREFIRLVCVNPDVSESDLESLLEAIVKLGGALPG